LTSRYVILLLLAHARIAVVMRVSEVTVTSRAPLCTVFWRNFLAIVIAHNVAFRGWLAIKAGPIQQLLKCAEDSVRWVG